jgi:hypothetical protein
MTTDNIERNIRIVYVYEHINQLKPTFRQEALQMIICSNTNEDNIIDKPKGAEIKFSDISDETLENVYKFIMNRLENNNIFG